MQSKIPCSLSAKLSNMGFFCAILVVLLHTESINYWPSTELMRTFLIKPLGGIAVPFFFVAAGYFLAGHIHEYNWWKRETEKRLRSLLLPYFIWEALYFTYSIPFVLLANILANAPLTRNIPDIISIFALNPMQGGGLGPLWFVRTLFVFVLISPIIATPIKLSRMIGGGGSCPALRWLPLDCRFYRRKCWCLGLSNWDRRTLFNQKPSLLRIWDLSPRMAHYPALSQIRYDFTFTPRQRPLDNLWAFFSRRDITDHQSN